MLAVFGSIVSFAFIRKLMPAALVIVMLAAGCARLQPAVENDARTLPASGASSDTVGSLAATPVDTDASRDDAPAPGRTSPSPTTPPGMATQLAERESQAKDAPLSAQATATPISSHTVAAGDTLTRIAERYGVSVASLLATNALSNPGFPRGRASAEIAAAAR